MKPTMFIALFLAIIFLLPIPSTSAGFEKAGIILPDTLYTGKDKLVLNGAGVRKKFGFKAYVAGLYLSRKTTDNNEIINADQPMTFTMYWRRSADPRKINLVFFKSFAISVDAPFEKIYTSESNYGELSEKIIKFVSWVAKKTTIPNDAWIYQYKPGEGTYVYMYDAEKKSEDFMGLIPGIDFKKALLRIWIGDKQSVGDTMKKDLLGLP
jgi:hypothetical protein